MPEPETGRNWYRSDINEWKEMTDPNLSPNKELPIGARNFLKKFKVVLSHLLFALMVGSLIAAEEQNGGASKDLKALQGT